MEKIVDKIIQLGEIYPIFKEELEEQFIMQMQNNRLTKMNQYGDILYCGPRNTNSYRNMGLYAKDLDERQIELVLSKLYNMEELIESLWDNLSKMSTTIHLLEKLYNAN